MKKILSIKYSAGAFNFSMLVLRVVFGLLMICKHGYDKLVKFPTLQYHFYNFLGMGSRISLSLAMFAEVLCSLFVVIGLFTRFATIPLIITMLVATFGANAGRPLVQDEASLSYLAAFIVLLFCGPGRISVDGMINK